MVLLACVTLAWQNFTTMIDVKSIYLANLIGTFKQKLCHKRIWNLRNIVNVLSYQILSTLTWKASWRSVMMIKMIIYSKSLYPVALVPIGLVELTHFQMEVQMGNTRNLMELIVLLVSLTK